MMKKAELDNRLLNLTKKGKLQVPGLGVIIYKDGKINVTDALLLKKQLLG